MEDPIQPIIQRAETKEGFEDVVTGYNDLSEVVIPAYIETNYNEDTKTNFCERVIGIREEINSIGDSVAQSAKYLYEIKKNLEQVKDKSNKGWTAFINSGLIELSPRACTDLANAYGKWLIDSDIRPELIANLSSRSLAAMANADELSRERVYNALESSLDLTEAEVRALLNPNKPKKKESQKVERKLTGNETKEQVIAFYSTEINSKQAEIDKLNNKAKALENKNETLIKKIALLEDKLTS